MYVYLYAYDCMYEDICVKGFIGCRYNTYIRKHAYEEIFFDIRINLSISENNDPHREENCYFLPSNTHFEPHRPCTRGRPRAGRRRSPSEYFRRDVAPKCQAPACGRLRSSAARDDVSAVSADAMATTFLCLRSQVFFYEDVPLEGLQALVLMFGTGRRVLVGESLYSLSA